MKHYVATLQCICGHQFTVCVHSARLIAEGKGVTVRCPVNGSELHIPALHLQDSLLCPKGAVIVRDKHPY